MIFEMPRCNGCRTCEMACSFKHKGEFSPSVSAIKVLNKGDGLEFLVSFAEKSDGNSLACIACRECIQYCPSSGDLDRIIAEFKGKVD